MHARRFDRREVHVFRFQPVAELTVRSNKPVFGAAGDPKQTNLGVGFGVEIGKGLIEILSGTAGAEGADPGKAIQVIEPDVEGLRSAHRKPGDGARAAISGNSVGFFDLRHHFVEKGVTEPVIVAFAEGRIALRGPGSGDDFRSAVAERHHDQHGLGFTLRDQVVEDDIRAANRGPAARIVAEAVQQVEHWIFLFCFRIVARRRVDVEIAIVANDAGMIEMMVYEAVRNADDFPRQAWAWDMDHALGVEQVGLDERIHGIHIADAIRDEGVAVEIGLPRTGGYGPNAFLIFLHGDVLPTFAREKDLFRVGIAKAEGNSAVALDLWRLDGLGSGLRLREHGEDRAEDRAEDKNSKATHISG